MKALPVNLASRPFRNNLLVGTLLTVLAVGMVAGTAYNLYVYLSYGAAYATLQHAQAEDRARIAELQKQERDLAAQIKTRDFRTAYSRGKLASELIRKSAFSWTQLFNTLEAVIPPDVVLAAIRPNITSDGIVLRLEGVAKSHGALLTLEEKLQGHDSFKRVAPISERRLNPNLPDITFLLTTDYIPPSQQPPVVTAANQPGDAAPATGGAAAAAAPPATGAAPPAAGTAESAGAPQDVAATTPGTGATAAVVPPATGSTVAGSVVGRDGLPKSPACSVIAPGGLLIAEAIAAPAPTKKGSRKPSAAGAGAASGATGANATGANATGTNAPNTTAAAPGSAAPNKTAAASNARPAPAGTPAKTAAGTATNATNIPAPAVAIPPSQRPIATPRGYDPNVPRTMPTQLQTSATRPKASPPPARAERLDTNLTFSGRPAGEVYRLLAEAHGVRIDLDPTVDPQTPVTVNLQGRRLEEALLLLSGVLHNQMTRAGEGVYRITSTEIRSPAGDIPPVEEPIVEEGQR